MTARKRIAPTPNPDYGHGFFRRRIRLINSPQRIEAQLEDNNHAFKVSLVHDNDKITSIEALPLRYPFSTCPGATKPIQSLLGHSLEQPLEQPLGKDFHHPTSIQAEDRKPGNNCTHIYDLVALAIDHLRRGEPERLYDIAVSDELNDTCSASVACNGKTIHSWQVKPYVIIAPETLRDGPLLKGFYRWAESTFQGDILEAARVLQRGYFVAQTRRFDYENTAGRMAEDDEMPEGACFSYNAGNVENAKQTHNMIRDFSEQADELLKFVP